MSASQKAAVLTRVGSSPHPTRRVLRDLGVPKSTYYRWLRQRRHQASPGPLPGPPAPPLVLGGSTLVCCLLAGPRDPDGVVASAIGGFAILRLAARWLPHESGESERIRPHLTPLEYGIIVGGIPEGAISRKVGLISGW